MTQVSRKGFRDKNGNQVKIVPNVPGATAGNLASFDAEGNLQDSRKKPADFAPANHGHDLIEESEHGLSKVEATEDDQEGCIKITLKDNSASPTPETATIDLDNIANLIRALATPSSIPEDVATKLITSKAVYDALLGKMANLRSMRITYNHVDDKFVVSESDKAVLVTFRNSAPEDTFVPVLVSLYDGNTKDSDVFGLAKWSEEQQPTAIDINILVVIGNYYFSADGDYQEIEDIRFTGWTRTVKGQSFFS